MKVTYLDHSGILVECKDRYYVFDYYKGELPPLDRKKEVLVFCSHCHGDHYNPKIFDLLDGRACATGRCWRMISMMRSACQR